MTVLEKSQTVIKYFGVNMLYFVAFRLEKWKCSFVIADVN